MGEGVFLEGKGCQILFDAAQLILVRDRLIAAHTARACTRITGQLSVLQRKCADEQTTARVRTR